MGSCATKEKQSDSYISNQSSKTSSRKLLSGNSADEGILTADSKTSMKNSGKINVVKKPTIEDSKWSEKWNNPEYTGS